MIYETSNLKQVRGYSMVEILGVLTVMGVIMVLSGTSIYSYAMKKHRANAILKDVSLALAETKTDYTVQENWHTANSCTNSGLAISTARNKKKEVFIKVEGVDSDVCGYLLECEKGSLSIYGADAATELVSCENNQTMVFCLENAATLDESDEEESCPTADCSKIIPVNNCRIAIDVKHNGCVTQKALFCPNGTYCSDDGTFCEDCPKKVTCSDTECCQKKAIYRLVALL